MKDYATIVNTLGSFPNVTGKNASGGGATDGTPYIRQFIDDLWGFSQALMNDAGLTPDGVTESASASQRMTALRRILGAPGEVIAWMGDAADPSAGGIRLLPLTGQGVLMASYPLLDAATYVGDPDNPTASAFYHAQDAAGTIRDTAGPYLILPDLRGYFLRGLDVSATTDPDGASRDIGDSQAPAVAKHRHEVTINSTPTGAPVGNIFADREYVQTPTETPSFRAFFTYSPGSGDIYADENAMYNLANAVLRESDARPWNSACRWCIRF
jgi:hypothetical protein